MKSARRQYSAALKAKVALAALSKQQRIRDIAEHFDLHPNLVSRWRNELAKKAENIFSSSSNSASLVPKNSTIKQAAHENKITHNYFQLQQHLLGIPADFLEQLAFDQFHLLFDALKEAQFWMKDTDCRYVYVNKHFLKNYSLSHNNEVSGKTDFDLSAHYLAERFAEADQQILNKGQAQINHIELVGHFTGTVNWYNTTKIPLRNRNNTIVGTAGITYSLDDESVMKTLYGEFGPIIEHIKIHISHSIRIDELAHILEMSLSSFERKFKAFFACTPHQYIKRLRVRMAGELLATTNQAITDIAYECGFADHSHLSRDFKNMHGCSPRDYRKTHEKSD